MDQGRAQPSRRMAFAASMGGVLALAGCGSAKGEDGKSGAGEEEVSATEDLMREHGVLRRILIVYRETGGWLGQGRTDFDAAALGKAADLFHVFGEEYHERALEEQHVFPVLQKVGGAGGALVPILLAQHERGRKITVYIRSRCAAGKIAGAAAPALSRTLLDFARMYEAHTAFEDTVPFQAWKAALSENQRDQESRLFEQIERSRFGGDGFEMAVRQISEIEQKLGLADLARYTAAPPPGGPWP
jgi:hemerythrin-like domain-containing protein